MAPVFYAPAAGSPAPKSLPSAQLQPRPSAAVVTRKGGACGAGGGSSFAANEKKRTSKSDVLFYLERATRLELVTGIPKMASGHFQEPCRTSD